MSNDDDSGLKDYLIGFFVGILCSLFLGIVAFSTPSEFEFLNWGTCTKEVKTDYTPTLCVQWTKEKYDEKKR